MINQQKRDLYLEKGYCNCLALDRGLDPVGHAGSFDDALVIEMPLPWKRDIMAKADPLPQQIIDLLALWLEEYQQTGAYRHRPLLIAPDDVYSREGHYRVMHYTRPAGPFAHYDKTEYLVPNDQLGPLAWALFQDRTALSAFEAFRVPKADTVRDILVCTHGTIDAACAKFGYPLYKHLRETYAADDLRVWRVSHFGGHVFAPTLMDMPTGHYWAYIELEQAASIVQRTGDVAALGGYYRGWAGAENGFQQAAEHHLWQQHGWGWFDSPKSAETVQSDINSDQPTWADVRLHYTLPGETTETTADVHVVVDAHVETPLSTDRTASHAYPQYRVTERSQS